MNNAHTHPADRRQFGCRSRLGIIAMALLGTVSACDNTEPTMRDSDDQISGALEDPIEHDSMANSVEAEPDLPMLKTVAALGFHPPTQQSDYGDCSSLKALNPKVSENLVCNAQPMANCPYGTDQMCTVSADFVNGKLKRVSFDYEYGSVEGDELKKDLDRALKPAPLEHKVVEELGMASWIANWRDGATSFSMMRFKGVNIEGVPYDNVSLVVTDETLPEPMKP